MTDKVITSLQAQANLRDAFRTEMGKISRQSAVFFAGTIFTLVAGFFFRIYTARVLGAQGIGLYALGTSVVAFASLFAHWGIPRAMVRFIPAYAAQNDAARIRGLMVHGGLVVTLVSSTLGIGLLLASGEIATRVFGKPDLTPILALFAFAIPLETLGFLLDQIIVGFQQTARSKSISSFFTYPLRIVLTVIFLNLGWGVSGYVLATLFSSAAGILALILVVRQLVPPSPHPAPPEPAVWRYAGVMAFLGIWSFLTNEADKLILGIYLPSSSVGVYSVAMTIAAFIPMLLTSVNSIFAPTISHLYAQGQRVLLEQLLQTLTKWILGLTVPLIGVILLFGSELMSLFGKEFQAGWIVLAMVALGQLVNVGTGSVGIMLLMTGHQRALIQTQISSVLVTLALYIVLIPELGILGAALGQAIGLPIANALNLWHVANKLKMTPYQRSFLKLIVPLSITGIALVGLRVWMPAMPELGMLGTSLALAYGCFGSSALVTGLDENDRLVVQAMGERIVGLVHGMQSRLNG